MSKRLAILEMQQKLPEKPGVVVAEMLIIGSVSIYFIQLAYPGGGFVRDLLAVTITGLVSSAFSVTLEKTARRKYLVMLSVVVALLLLTVCWVKLSFKETLTYAWSACKFADHLPSDDPHSYIPTEQKLSEYWKNY